ncbi:MAG: hypothetical protein ACTSQI_02790 [Candidatus Helarchaeota archaeon]
MSFFVVAISLFITVLLMVLIFLALNTSEVYVTLASTWVVVLGIALVLKIPVRFFRRISPPYYNFLWPVEKSPPDWLSKDVLALKHRVSWLDRARFWYLILSYGTQSAHKIVGPRFIPQLFAKFFQLTFNKLKQIVLDFDRSLSLFSHNPIKSYLRFAGSLSGGALNWIFESVYRDKFIKATRNAGAQLGRYEALCLKHTGLFPGNDVKTLMSMIMYIYVVYGLTSWMRYCYPTVAPYVEASADHSIVRFCQGPYECPHHGLKYPSFCDAFISWEAALAETINPRLTAKATKRAVAGDEGCEVSVLFKKMNQALGG